MQPIDRDTQIKLMKNSDVRKSNIVKEMLHIRELRESAKRCSFEERDVTYSTRTVKVAKYA